MSNIVIVSSHCYLLCEAIEHISIDICGDSERDEADFELVKSRGSKRKKAKKPTRRQKEEAARLNKAYYQVTITFIAVNRNQNKSGGDQRSLQIVVQGQEKAMNLYKEIVTQIREQLPDQMFLNDLVSKLLG